MQQPARSLFGSHGAARKPAGGMPLPPHLRGRAEFESLFGALARGKRNWQLVAFGSLGVSALLAGGLVTLATRSRITPYVVEVDRLGHAQSFGPAEQLRLTDRRVVSSQIATFVHDLRTIVGDQAAQSDLVRRAYAFADQGAANFLNTYFADASNDPRLLGRDQTRLVEVTGILPVPGASMPGAPHAADVHAPSQGATALPATWKVSWIETVIPRSLGGSSEVSAWEGYVTTRLVPPRDAERIALNPLGLYVTSVTWTRLTVKAGPPNGAGAESPDAAGAVTSVDPSAQPAPAQEVPL
jgi:type IV secretion system protein VirB5